MDSAHGLVLVTNGAMNRIDVFDLDDPGAAPGALDLGTYGNGVQSVAVHDGLAVAVVSGETVLDSGTAVFPDPADLSAEPTAVAVGALPDMVTFSPDGRWVLVANEGEPRCVGVTDPTEASNPEGSVSVIEIVGGAPGEVRTAGFAGFNGDKQTLREAGVRLEWRARRSPKIWSRSTSPSTRRAVPRMSFSRRTTRLRWSTSPVLKWLTSCRWG